jgi:hypothetical protein
MTRKTARKAEGKTGKVYRRKRLAENQNTALKNLRAVS